MMRASDDLDDLLSDFAHLATLIGVITEKAIDICVPDEPQSKGVRDGVNDVSDLLWIARDMIEQLKDNSEACYSKVAAERRALKAVVVEPAP